MMSFWSLMESMFRKMVPWCGFGGAYSFLPSGPYDVASSLVVQEALCGSLGPDGGLYAAVAAAPPHGLGRALSRIPSVFVRGFRTATWPFFSSGGGYRTRKEFFPRTFFFLRSLT